MTRLEKIIKQDEERLMYLYAKANTKSKKKKIAHDLFSFSSMYYRLFGIYGNFFWENDDKLINILKNPSSYIVKESQNNKEVFDNISNSVIRTYKESDFDFYKNYGKKIKILPYDELKDIFLSFLNSYDEDLSNIFLKRLNDNEINFSNKLDLANGMLLSIQSLDKTPLFIKSDLNLSLYTTSVLAHEFGHLYEYEIVKKSITESHFFVSASSIYHEVSSQFFRYLFLNYLRDNNIYISNVDILFSRYYLIFLDYIVGLNFICNNDVVFDRNLNMESSDELLQFLSDIREKFNYYNIVSDNIVNYKDSFIYGIGSLFSVYLYDTYKKDSIGFKKEFKNAMINYPRIGMEAFKNLGITREVLEDGSILKRVLKK